MANTHSSARLKDAAAASAAQQRAAQQAAGSSGGIKEIPQQSFDGGQGGNQIDSFSGGGGGSNQASLAARQQAAKEAAEAAYNTAKRQAKDAEKNKAWNDARKAIDNAASKASTMKVKPQETSAEKENTEEDIPQNKSQEKDPMRSTGYVDLNETGELIETTGQTNQLASARNAQPPVTKKNIKHLKDSGKNVAQSIVDEVIDQERKNPSSVLANSKITPGRKVRNHNDAKNLKWQADSEFFGLHGRYPLKDEVIYHPEKGTYEFKLDEDTGKAKIVKEGEGQSPVPYEDIRMINNDYLNFRNADKNKDESDEDAIKRNRREAMDKHPDAPPRPGSNVVEVDEEGNQKQWTVHDLNRLDRAKAENDTIRTFLIGGLRIEGTTIDEDGNYVFPKIVDDLITFWTDKFGCSRTTVMQLFMLRLGVSVDANGKILNDSFEDFKLTPEEFLKASNVMEESMKLNGHPLGRVDTIRMRMGGSWRFSIPVYTRAMAEDLTKSGDLAKLSPHQLIEKGRQDWLNKTKPAIIRNCTGDKLNQRYALDSMARAIASIDGMSLSAWGLSPLEQATYEELMDNAINAQENDKEDADVYKLQEERLELAKARWHNQNWKKTSKDENGNWNYKAKQGPVSRFFMGMGNLMRTMGVIGNVPLMASGYAEHFIGNVNTFESNFILRKTLGNNASKFVINENLRSQAFTPEAKEAIAAYKILESAGGADAQTVFANSGMAATIENAKKFIIDGVERKESNIKWVNNAKQLAEKINDVAKALMPGDIGFRGQDAYLYLQSLALCMGEAERQGRPFMTTKEMSEALSSEGIGKLINESMKYQSGREAFIMMSNQNFNRISPLGYAVNKIMRSNGVTNFALTTCLDTYVNYGVNLLQLMMPFSNTMSYITVKAVTNDSTTSNIMNYQLGGSDSFWDGLKKNFIYDAMRLGNISLISVFAYLVLDALGFDDPEDPALIYNWDEYRIGGKIGLGKDTNGDGEADGNAYRIAWWMNDLVQWGFPLAVAMHVHKNHPEDPERAINVFWDGMYDMVSGSAVLDMIDAVRDGYENLSAFDEATQSENAVFSDDWISNVALIGHGLLAQTTSKITPSILKNWNRDTFFVGEEARDRSAYKVYDRSSDNAKERMATDYVENSQEALIRSWSKYNPLYALFNNITRNGYLFDDGTTEKTGYLFSEMPVATMSDQRALQYYNMFDFDYEKDIPIEGEERQQELERRATELLNYIDSNFDNPDQASVEGFMIPYNARENAITYCYTQILLNKLDYANKSKAGEYPDWASSNAAYTYMTKANKKYYDYLDDYLQNSKIPWSNDTYEKLISDYQLIYTWKDSGKPANAFDALWNGNAVEKRYVPYGNHPTSFSLFTSVDTKDRGYNAETIPNWYTEGATNTQKIFDQAVGDLVRGGRDEGKELAGVLFGGYGPDETNPEGYNIAPNGIPTINYRSYVPSERAMTLRTNGNENGSNAGNGSASGSSSNTNNGSGNGNGSNQGSGSGSNGSSSRTVSTSSLPNSLAGITIETVANALGIDIEKDIENPTNDSWNNKSSYSKWYGYTNRGGGRSYGGRSGGGSSSSYNPKIYSNPRSINADKAATMYTKTPYGATTSYLRPGFSTKGSREAYKRSDI